MENTYKNPFSEYNANVMDTGMILEYWSNPFSFVKFGLTEQDIFSDPNPIVFMGGRGTGKTMFLRYCSHNVQIEKLKADKKLNANFLDKLSAACFYIRIDGPILRSFEGFGVSNEKWGIIFAHYFELYVCKSYFTFFQNLIKNNDLKSEDINSDFFIDCSNLIAGEKNKLQNINAIIEFIDERLKEVTQFRTQIPLREIDFLPLQTYSSQTLTFGITEIAKKHITRLTKDFTFVIMIDEYENFMEPQQRIINTLLKFVKPGLTFRLGMRLEGFRTYDTISADDFIKEGRDYRNVIFEEVLIKDSGYSDYLKDIANKRLKKVKHFSENNLTDITDFLGKREDLVQEAKEIVGEKADKIFDFYNIHTAKDRELLRCEENPLLQVMNCLWYKRGSSSKEINKTMIDYLSKGQNTKVKKYKMDYVDKYKLSLTFIIATIYKKDKSYYSFNTFSYLSSGIIGHFIELCRRCFQYAEFENKKELIEKGIIPKNLQNNAARDLAESELQQSRRIEKYGNKLYVFTMSLGNIFREHHKDPDIKYPETNQFSVDKTLLPEPIKGAFEAAQRWSIIQRKSKAQQQSIGKKKNDIFTLNRIFSPLFQISYRTRGGYSEEFSTLKIGELMDEVVKGNSIVKKGKKVAIENDSQKKLEL